MEIVADGDEREALVEELADARSAEEEEAEDDVVLPRGVDELVGRGLEFRRSIHVGELVLLKEAHGHAEVVLPEEQHVDAGDGGDGIDVLDAGRGFDLEGDGDVRVRGSGITEESGLVGGALGEVDGAGAGGGVAGAGNGLASFLGGVDVGDEDTVGAEVERLLDAGAIIVAADADHGEGSAGGDGAKHGGEVLMIHGSMLGVDEEPVVAGVRELFGDGGGMGVKEEAEFRRAGAELRLEFGTGKCVVRHRSPQRNTARGILGVSEAIPPNAVRCESG